MQIREQGRKIQLLRSVYDPSVKKCKQVLVGSIPRYGDRKLSPEIQAAMSYDELKSFNDWVTKKLADSAKLECRYQIRQAEQKILDISNAVNSADNVDQAKIDAIKVAIKCLQKSVKRAEKKLILVLPEMQIMA